MFGNAEAPCTPFPSPFLNLLSEKTTACMCCLSSLRVFVCSQVMRFTSLFCFTAALPDSLGPGGKGGSQNMGQSLFSSLAAARLEQRKIKDLLNGSHSRM